MRRRSRPRTLENAGQFELWLTGAPLAVIASAAEVSEMAASLWMRGQARPDYANAQKLEHAFGIPSHLWGLLPPPNEGQRLCQLLGVRPPAEPDAFEKGMLYSFFFVPLDTWKQKPGRLRTWEQLRDYVEADRCPNSMPSGDVPLWGAFMNGPRTIRAALAAEDRRNGWRNAEMYTASHGVTQ